VSAISTTYEVRPYTDADEIGVIGLLRDAMGEGPAGERTPAFFRWKHLENPFGRSFMLVAEADGRPIGFRAFLRWRFRAEGRVVEAVQAVDTATHPDHQGRGVFSRLTMEALEALRGDVDLVFNTPNEKSLPGYLKMGWRVVGRIPVNVRVRRPLRFAAGIRSLREGGTTRRGAPVVIADDAASILETPGIEELLAEAELASGIATARDLQYLRWRYGDPPGLSYHAVLEERGGRVAGIAIFRVRPRAALWEATVLEVIVRQDDIGTARRLLRRLVAAADVDHLTCRFPSGSAALRAARRTGYLPSSQGITFVVNPLSEIEPDPGRLSSWALTLGDVEVF